MRGQRILIYEENRGVSQDAAMKIGATYGTYVTNEEEIALREVLSNGSEYKFVVVLWHETSVANFVKSCIENKTPVLVIKDRTSREDDTEVQKEIIRQVYGELGYKPGVNQLIVRTTNVQKEFQNQRLLEHVIAMESSLKNASYSVPEAEQW